jgi:hypothetical protein
MRLITPMGERDESGFLLLPAKGVLFFRAFSACGAIIIAGRHDHCSKKVTD